MRSLCFLLFVWAVPAVLGQSPPAGGNASDMGRKPGGAPASFEVRSFQSKDGQKIEYSLFVPKNIRPGEKLPLVICLHGSGGNTAAAKVLALAERQAKHPCIIMAPGCDSTSARWVAMPFRAEARRGVLPELLGALDVVIGEFPVDARRVYLTGQSMGGAGTWGILATNPERIAAAAPVCGFWRTEDAVRMTNVPVWVFHGDMDPEVSVENSRQMVAALKVAGASPRYTEYSGVGHDSWSTAYATDALWDWMFAQRKK